MTENPKPVNLAALHAHLRNQLEGAAYNLPDITDYAAVAAWGSMLAGLAQALAAIRVELDRERESAARPLPVEQPKPAKVRLVWGKEGGSHYLAPAGADVDGAYYSTAGRYAFRFPGGGLHDDRRVPVDSLANGLRVITDMARADGYECDEHPDAAPAVTAPILPPGLVVATAKELDETYAAFDRMTSSSIRAGLQGVEMRSKLIRMTAERDAAVAELTNLRATPQPVEAQKPSLVWFQSPQGHYWLLGVDGTDWHDVPYAAHKSGIGESEPDGTHHRCESWPAACAWIAEKARSDGYDVSPHPQGWDIGKETSNG